MTVVDVLRNALAEALDMIDPLEIGQSPARIIELRKLSKSTACATVENGGPYQVFAECVHIARRELDDLIAAKSCGECGHVAIVTHADDCSRAYPDVKVWSPTTE